LATGIREKSPESLLKGSALQRQQAYTLPPLEQWYFALLNDGRLPGALINNNALSKNLTAQHCLHIQSEERRLRTFPKASLELSLERAIAPSKGPPPKVALLPPPEHIPQAS
jgi:hypothetical protein